MNLSEMLNDASLTTDIDPENFAAATGAVEHLLPLAIPDGDGEPRERAYELLSELSDGLDKELEHLETIFATKDAYEGLSALIQGRRPSYTNE